MRNNGVYGGGGGASLTKDKLPMPDSDELERRFTKVLVRHTFIWSKDNHRYRWGAGGPRGRPGGRRGGGGRDDGPPCQGGCGRLMPSAAHQGEAGLRGSGMCQTT